MKTISRVMLLTAAATAFTIIGCKKEDNTEPINPSAPATGSSSFNSLFAHKGAQSQMFTIDNNSSQSITGAQGTQLTFDPNSFVTLTGAPVSGSISIELKEVFDKKSMLLSNASVNAELYPGGPAEPLISGGEIYVNAKQGSAQLKLAPGQHYLAFIPSATSPDPGMTYFKGKSTPTGILWGESGDSTTFSTSSAPQGYLMSCDSIHWGNADMFMAAPNYTTISLHLSGTYDASQIKAYVWYDNVRTIWGFWHPIDNVTHVYSDDHTAVGSAVHFIVVSVKDGKLYSAIYSTTVTSSGSYNVTLAETTEDAFASSLNALP